MFQQAGGGGMRGACAAARAAPAAERARTATRTLALPRREAYTLVYIDNTSYAITRQTII